VQFSTIVTTTTVSNVVTTVVGNVVTTVVSNVVTTVVTTAANSAVYAPITALIPLPLQQMGDSVTSGCVPPSPSDFCGLSEQEVSSAENRTLVGILYCVV